MSTQPAADARRTPTRDLDDWCPSRRTVMRSLAAIGGVALVPSFLTACAADDGSSGTGSEPDGGAASGAGGGVTVPAADVAVGTAVVVADGDDHYVVAQPAEGEFVAYDARCTHQSTVVEARDGLTLTCPNHGSQFDATDGSVLRDPATQPLAAVTVTLEGALLVLAA